MDEETKEYLKNIAAAEWKVYKAEKEKYDEEIVRAAADNRINAQYTASSRAMVQSQDQGKFFRVGKMRDSSRNEGLMKSMQPIQQNIDLVQQENNDMSPNMPTTVMPNMSGPVCQSRPFSLPASHKYDGMNIDKQNGVYSKIADVSSQAPTTFSITNRSNAFSMSNIRENAYGNRQNTNIGMSGGRMPITNDSFNIHTLRHSASFAPQKARNRCPATNVMSNNYFSMPNMNQNYVARESQAHHSNDNDMANAVFSQDDLITRFPNGITHDSTQQTFFASLGKLYMNRTLPSPLTQNQDQNEGAQCAMRHNNITSYLRGVMIQNGDDQRVFDISKQAESFSQFTTGTSLNHHPLYQNSFSASDVQSIGNHPGIGFEALSTSMHNSGQVAGASSSMPIEVSDQKSLCDDSDTLPDAFSDARFHPVEETSLCNNFNCCDAFDGNISLRSIDFRDQSTAFDKSTLVKTEDEDNAGSFHGHNSLRSIDCHIAQPYSARFHPVDEENLSTRGNHSLSSIEFHSTQSSSTMNKGDLNSAYNYGWGDNISRKN